jgi:predicted RNA-binding protein YlqC (UPF0109 family)
MTTRVLLGDDEALRTDLTSLIEAEDDLEVVGEAADGRLAVEPAERGHRMGRDGRDDARELDSAVKDVEPNRRVIDVGPHLVRGFELDIHSTVLAGGQYCIGGASRAHGPGRPQSFPPRD